MRCFDFCLTLVSVNTTYSFVDYCVNQSGLYFKVKLFCIKIVSKLLLDLKIIDSHLHSKFRVSAISGIELTKLRAFSREFSIFLDSKVNDEVFDVFTSYDASEVLIVSNALEFVIRDFLILKGLQNIVIGSTLMDDSLICLGKYQSFIPDIGKVNSLLSRCPNVVIDEFFTDDFEADSDLVQFSASSRLVSKGRIL